MSGTLQLLVCTNDAILFGKNVNIFSDNSMNTEMCCCFVVQKLV